MITKEQLHAAMSAEGLPLFAAAPFEQVKQYMLEPEYEFSFEPQSVIFAALPYSADEQAGNLARYARGRDYHLELPERLNRAALRLGLDHTASFADVSPFAEVSAAESAGLGKRGENGLLFCAGYGSFCLLGELVTDEKVPALTAPSPPQCLHCGKCKRECPAQIIGTTHKKTEKCLSAITQKKGELSEEEKSLILNHNLIWGCDCCQLVCPLNQNLDIIEEQNRLTSLTLGDLESLSNRAFMKCYRDRAFAYRGKGPLFRNLKWFEKE